MLNKIQTIKYLKKNFRINYFYLSLFLVFLVLSISLYAYKLIKRNKIIYTVSASNWENYEKNIYIHYNNIFYKTKTNKNTVKELLEELNIAIQEDDYLFPALDQKLETNNIITIKEKFNYTIQVDDQTIEGRAFPKPIEEILADNEIKLNEFDKLEPESRYSILVRDMEIIITRIEIEEVMIEEEIDFETIEKDDPDMYFGETEISQAGEEGLKENRYKITYKDGIEDERELIETKIVKDPQNRIILNGTKLKLGKASKGQASWYAYTGTMACASLEHPKGTWLKVTNLENGKSVKVVVNDSGPYVPGRIIDLDKVAFEKIANLGQGVIDVKVEKIENK
jgi:uncharacterized protein YabE (DUF348 family)